MAHDSRLFSSISLPSQAKTAARSTALRYAPVRFSDLRSVAMLQKRAFKPRLAYGFSTLVLLWALPHVRFLVAKEDGAIAGCAIGDRNGGQSRVVNICVDPAMQRRGVGAELLRRLEQALPIGDVMLMVESENTAARALYKKEGYKDVGVSKSYYGRGNDGIWMQKQRSANPRAKIRI